MQEDNWSYIEVQVKRLPHSKGLDLPKYITEGASGLDLFAAIDDVLDISPGDIVMVPTGLCVSIPAGFELQIRPRSGLAIKHGITVVNAPGTIDSDYRGEIKVGLINLSKSPFRIERGMRIAQAVLSRVYRLFWEEKDVLSNTKRGSGGFGHTGIK